jgi:hypothetical protein
VTDEDAVNDDDDDIEMAEVPEATIKESASKKGTAKKNIHLDEAGKVDTLSQNVSDDGLRRDTLIVGQDYLRNRENIVLRSELMRDTTSFAHTIIIIFFFYTHHHLLLLHTPSSSSSSTQLAVTVDAGSRGGQRAQEAS